MSDFVQRRVEGQVGTITLARPEVHNAFDDRMMIDLTGAIRAFEARDDVRVVVLKSEGKSFSAGADIHWMKRMAGYSFEENVADARQLSDMLRAIRDASKPVVARVHGAAFGGAVGLVAAADIAVATARAVFCLSEVKLGIVPAVISPFVVEKIGLGRARRYALTAERFDAREACAIGLVHDVVSTNAELDPWIDSVIAHILKNGPNAVAACKNLLRDVASAKPEEVQELTVQRIAKIRVSPEGQEGLKAFLEKRPPQWISKAQASE